MIRRLASSLPLLLACSCAAPTTVNELPPPAKAGEVVTASTPTQPSNDSMLLEAKLAVCEEMVRTTGESHALEVLGFKSLLPPQHAQAQPKSEDVVGVWRSGFNPIGYVEQGKRIPVFEERIHYLADGRVCGIQQTFDPTMARSDRKQIYTSFPFAGTWKLIGNTIVEDYSKGTPPEEVRAGGQTRRSRKVDSLNILLGHHEPEPNGRGRLRFEGKWPNYFETVAKHRLAALLETQEESETMKGELPPYCFKYNFPSKYDFPQNGKAEK